MLARINDNVVDDQTTIDPGTLQANRAELQLAQVNALRLRREAYTDVVVTLPEENVSSSNFSISFDYCLVNVARSWLSSTFLTAANWYASGSQNGAFAGGTYEGAPRPFAFLPAKFLVIKNLKISAQWSQEDRTYLQKSASLGPFALVNKSFEQEILTCPGMQIIAWFCQIMPQLPPCADPNLAQ
jgi:hypothetical protein